MKSFAIMLFLLANVVHASGMEELERVVNQSPIVLARCQNRECQLSPVAGSTVQDFRDEVTFVKKHLNGLGVRVRVLDGLPRQGKVTSVR